MRERGKRNNIFLVVIFAVCVMFLITASLTIKFIGTVQNSSYHSGRFTVLLLDSTHKAVYLSVDETENIGSKLVVNTSQLYPKLPIGVDGIVRLSSEVDENKSATALISEMLIKRNEERVNITFLDLIRMYIALRKVPSEDMKIIRAEKEEDVTVNVLSDLFVDEKIIDEDKTIAIENASSTPGVATKLENIIDAMGGNVISVETSVSPVSQSKIISYGEKSYTLEKISSFLGYPVELVEDTQIADISIIIGEDGFGNLVFPQ